MGNLQTKACPVCSNLFRAVSELCDRRPLVACVNGDTVCADCYNECRKRTDGKCPICGDDLLSTPVINEELMKLINFNSELEIPVSAVQIEEKPFACGSFGKVYVAKWRRENVVVKIIKAPSEQVKEDVKCVANRTVRLNHPNVIKLFGITYVKQRKFGIVMEKAEHGSLDTWIGKIDREKLTKIALGLSLIHI